MSQAELELKKQPTGKNKGTKALKAGLGYVISQLIVKGASFISTPLFSRFLSQETFGAVKAYEGWLQILLPIFTLSLYTSIERAKYEFKDELDDYVGSVQTLITITTLGLFVCSIPLFGIIGGLLDMNMAMYITMFLYFITNAAILNFQRRIKLDYRAKDSMILSLLNILPSIMIALAIIILSKYVMNTGSDLLLERILGFYIPQILVGGYIVYILLKKSKSWINKKYWSFALKFSLPMIPSQVSVSVLNHSSLLMVEALSGKVDAAIFSMASTVMYILYVIEQAIGDAWLPWLFEKLDSKQHKDLQKPWLGILLGTMYMSWGVIMFAPEVVLIFGGAKYAASVYIAAPIITGALFHFFTFSYINIEKFYNSTKTIAFASILAMFVNLILTYFGIQWFGYQAAAYTYMICYFLIMVFQAFMVKVITGEFIISLTNTLTVSFLSIVVNLLSMSLLELGFFTRILICIVVTILAVLVAVKIFNVNISKLITMVRKKVGGKK